MVAKLPKRSGLHDEIKAKYWAALDEATDPADAERRLRALVAELERPYPSAAACLTEDLPALCIHLNYFPRLRKRFRSSNLLERSLEEVRPRTKVIGRFPGETSCLSMCWAVLDLFLAGARGSRGRRAPRRARGARPRRLWVPRAVQRVTKPVLVAAPAPRADGVEFQRNFSARILQGLAGAEAEECRALLAGAIGDGTFLWADPYHSAVGTRD